MSAKPASSYSYQMNGVPDFDQKWEFLPNDGRMYCAPTATLNWLQYITQNGGPRAVAFPISSDRDYSQIYANLGFLGGYMNTDPETGTVTPNYVEGLVNYFEHLSIPAIVATESAMDSRDLSLADLQAVSLMRGLVIVTLGRYGQGTNFLRRTGGHALSMVGFENRGSEGRLEIRDPGDDENLQTQSARDREPVRLKMEFVNLEGNPVRLPRWGDSTDPYAYLDG
jgi:hypothetical protein